MGDLAPGKPWTYMPTASRLYFRKSQLPAGERFRTKTAMAVEMLREVDAESAAPVLAAFDGAYAMETVIKPCLNPPEGKRRIEFVTRLRRDARLYEPLDASAKNPKGGRPRKWGKRLPSPQEHDQVGRALATRPSLRLRHAFARSATSACDVAGRSAAPNKSWLPLCSRFPATTNCGRRSPVPPTCRRAKCSRPTAGRFRQEDGFRDHKQRLGMEECRAWTKEPVLRTFQIQMTALTLLRLMQFRLARRFGEAWCPAAALELGQTSRVDPRSASAVLEASFEVFASHVRLERLAKTSPNQISQRPAHQPGRIKS